MVNYPDRFATRSAVNHAVKLLEVTHALNSAVFEELINEAKQARAVLDAGDPKELAVWPLLHVSGRLGSAVIVWTDNWEVTCPAMILTLFRSLEKWVEAGFSDNFAKANSVTRTIPDAPVVDATVSERQLIRQRDNYLQTIVENLKSSGSQFSAVISLKPDHHYQWTVRRQFSGWTYEQISDELVNGKLYDPSTVRSAVSGITKAIGFEPTDLRSER
jgi:hypothetical protein